MGCGTEGIFASKSGLHDAVVTGGRVIVTNVALAAALMPTSSDALRVQRLAHALGVMNRLSVSSTAVPPLARFFASVNNTLARTLAQAGDALVLTQDDMCAMSFDPSRDADFLKALVAAQCPEGTRLLLPKCFGLC